MYCEYCGTQIQDNVANCPNCNRQVANHNNGQNTPYQNNNINSYNNMPPAYSRPSSGYNVPTRIPVALYVSLGIVAVIFIVVSILFFTGTTSGPGTSFGVTYETIPEKTESESVVLSGTAISKNNSANLVLNGDFIDSISSNEGSKTWSRTVYLNPGVNNFVLTLTDNLGKSQSSLITIERTVPLTYAVGTVLVKSNKSEIYIRPTPQISDKYIILLASNDYTSQFVCVGEEHTDPEGYIWCKVSTPANGIGWVRSDLMKIKQ